MNAIASPCIRLCLLDPVHRICVGCGRTGDEIGQWMRYSERERRSIMEALPGRLQALPQGAGS